MTFADIPAGASVFIDADVFVYHAASPPNIRRCMPPFGGRRVAVLEGAQDARDFIPRRYLAGRHISGHLR